MERTTTTRWREDDLKSCTTESRELNPNIAADITYRSSTFYRVSKRLFDILLAAIGVVVLLPIFLTIAIGIKLEDGGSIFYFREMIGLRGRRFNMLKFRTMIPHADTYLEQKPQLKLEYQKNMKLQDDPRITRLGRFLRKVYLDEFPQLFNVLAGHMSLVGPRAIHERELILYGEHVKKRHSVKPGITGPWQISPDRYRCYEDRIPLDMHYIDNRSFLLDLGILLKTFKIFINPTGV